MVLCSRCAIVMSLL
nr:unnamed protein product [Callosobruchus analis]